MRHLIWGICVFWVYWSQNAPYPSLTNTAFFFTREYTVEKFIEEHLSSQTGLLLAPCAWCETTNISLKTVSLLNRKFKVTERWRQTDSYLHTFHKTLLPTHAAAQWHSHTDVKVDNHGNDRSLKASEHLGQPWTLLYSTSPFTFVQTDVT